MMTGRELEETLQRLTDAGRARYPELYVVLVDFEDELVRFFPEWPFWVDGVRYERATASGVCRMIVSEVPGPGHDCESLPGTCYFDIDADSEHPVPVGWTQSDAYRWREGMVYYRTTQFDTPPYGG